MAERDFNKVLDDAFKYMDMSVMSAEKMQMLTFTRWLAEISLREKVPVKELYDRWLEACNLVKKGRGKKNG